MECAFLERGFRPFFFFGALYAVISAFIWGGIYSGMIEAPAFMADPILWHAHEMIYGFAMAIVAGFLLTAVANWTGTAPTRQTSLALLVGVWGVARFVINVDLGLPNTVVYGIELLFIPCIAISLSIPLVKKWNKRNFVFLFLLMVLFICDLLFLKSQDKKYLYSAAMVIVMMISLIGGRIIPAFTVAALRQKGEQAFQTPQPKTDGAALLSLVALIVLMLLDQGQGYLMAAVASTSLVVHLLRFRHYHSHRTLNDPLLWILHLGYVWLLVGLVFFALCAVDLVAFSTGFHAFTAGAIGTMTLGMMVRVALGHTGRPLVASKLTTGAFVLMQAAVVLRVVVPIINPENIDVYIPISAYLWVASFVIYLWVYSPILWQPRPDGRKA